MGERMKFGDLDIPEELKRLLEAQGFSEMYPPQAEAIPKALSGRNLVAAVPTASGKSLIGFIPALTSVLRDRCRVLYIVPLKALASEKRDDLAKFSDLGIRTVSATGDPDRDEDIGNADIVIATSEKADSLIRHGNRWLDGLGLLIADEVHMIHDPGRGPTLEAAMTKLMLRNPRLQVIALSATVSNAEDLARWLDADLVKSDWRPTKLREGVYFNGEIVFDDASSVQVPPEKDEMWGLIKQTVQEGGQAMVFVNSRRSAESLASKYAKRMLALTGSSITKAERTVLEGGAETTAVGTKLAECVSCGIAFHHAGLAYGQRRAVEDGFRGRRIKCIVATPTLAAGINLPARRVIVRDTSRFEANAGSVPIPVMEIKQMCGRAGRPGYDPWGEAVLIAKSYEDYEHLMDDYVCHDTERITSKLGNEAALRSHILGLIATGDAGSEDSIKTFLESTFFGSTSQMYGVEQLISNVVDFLDENGMVETAGDSIRILPFGKRASDLYIDPWTAVILKKAVLKMDSSADELQIMQAIACTPDIMGMYPKKGDRDMLESIDAEYDGDWLCTIEDECGTDDGDVAWDNHMSDLKTAVLLRDWIEERPEESITEGLGVGPGDIRSRVDSADWILYAMNEVAMIFNPDASGMIKPLLTRMRYGVKEELIPLVSLRGIGRARARTLFNAGLRTRGDIARADESEIASLPKIGPFLARSLKEQVGTEAPALPPEDAPPQDDEADYMLEKMAAEEEARNAGGQKSLDSYR